MSIIDVLYQDQFWVGQDGYVHPLAEMHQEYRLNVLAYLERHAERLAHQRDRYIRSAGVWRNGRPRVFPSPADWIVSTPFVIALRAHIAVAEAIDGEVVSVTLDDDVRQVAARLLLERHGSGDDGR